MEHFDSSGTKIMVKGPTIRQLREGRNRETLDDELHRV